MWKDEDFCNGFDLKMTLMYFGWYLLSFFFFFSLQQAVLAKQETKQDCCMKTELLREGKGEFTGQERGFAVYTFPSPSLFSFLEFI
jgi:hypothetical protein